MRYLFLLVFACASWGAGSTCSGTNTLTVLSDITLNGTDSIDWASCTVFGVGQPRVIIGSSWTGHIAMNGAKVYGFGRQGASATSEGFYFIGPATEGGAAYMGTGAYINIQNTTFKRCFAIARYYPASTNNPAFTSITFTGNTWDDGTKPPLSSQNGGMWVEENYPSDTTLKVWTNNKIKGNGWLDTRSQNWTVTGNIIIGARAGIYLRGTNGYANLNYLHDVLANSPQYSYFSQAVNSNVSGTGAVMENSIFNVGQWVVQQINGTLQDNVIYGASPHQLVRNGSGTVQRNILYGVNPAADQYTSTARTTSGDAAIGYTQTGDSFQTISNTFDMRGRAFQALVYASPGASVYFRDNAIYQLWLTTGYSAYYPYTAGDNNRAVYMDYNFFNLDPATLSTSIFGISIAGGTQCTGNWGTHDLGGCPATSQSATNLFRGPLPIGKTTYSGGTPTGDSGFPFSDDDIWAGTYTVSQMLTYFRWVYSPGVGSPLIGASSTGGTIGALAFNAGSAPSIVTTNKAPVVNVGPAYFTEPSGSSATIHLNGYAADDALPSGTLTTTWSVVSGPKSCQPVTSCVTIASAAQPITTATVTTNGTYIFQLSATDGTLASTKQSIITVGPLPAHPRIWLTSEVQSRIAAKALASDPDYLRVKAIADNYLTKAPPTIALSDCTIAATTECTTVGSLPWTSGTATLAIGGGTGDWAAAMNSGNTAITATRTGTNTFTLPVSTVGFAAFAGQDVVAYLHQTSNLSNSYTQGNSDLEDLAVTSEIAYLATGNTAYRDKMVQYLDYENSLAAHGITYMVRNDAGRGNTSSAPAVAFTLDSLYSELSSAQKKAAASTIGLWTAWCPATPGICYSYTSAGSNYYFIHKLAESMAAGAVADDAPWLAQSLLLTVTNGWQTVLAKLWGEPSTTQKADDSGSSGAFKNGYIFLGSNYGPNDVSRISRTAISLQTGFGLDLTHGNATDLSQFAHYLLYYLKPDNYKSATHGAWTAAWYQIAQQAGTLLLTEVLSGAPAAYMQWQLQHWGSIPPAAYTNAHQNPQDFVMWYDASRTATDYTLTEPPYAFIDGTQANIVWRSDWTSNAVYSSIILGQQLDPTSLPKHAGHIDITRGTDYLLTQSAYWMGITDGLTGTPAMNSGGTESGSANSSTLYVDDSANAAKCYTGYGYTGCQTALGLYRAPKTRLTNTYAFGESDLTTAYLGNNPQPVQYYFRSWLAMGDGTFVVWDRAHSTGATDVKQLRWHLSSASTPVNSGGIVSSVVGASKLYIQPLLPASASIAVVRNQNLLGESVNWHVEVSDPSPAQLLNGLTVLYATSNAGALPTSATITTDAAHVGVQISDTVPKVAVLPAAITGTGPYSVPTYNTVSFTSTHLGTGRYVVTGLAAGTYTISGGSGGTTVAGTDGTAYFTSTAGAITLSQGCGITPTSVGPYTVGQVVSQTFTAPSCASSSWGSSGAFPTGLSFTAGVLSGTASAAGTFTPTLTYDTASQPLSIVVTNGIIAPAWFSGRFSGRR